MTRNKSAGTETDAFGLYVHWPFCLSKCPYCDFNSHVRKETIDEDRIARAIDLLPEDQREVFLMRQVSGLSFKEIGEIVGAPENTVKSRMRYALDKLRTELADFNRA